TVSVTGPAGFQQTQVVAASSLSTFYLPWVAAPKGADTDTCGTAVPFPASVLALGAAYHLVSDLPVAAYQFNALEYQGVGGPAGKSWATCPGIQTCSVAGQSIGCYAFSNDASLLLPSTAWTGNYRISGEHGWSVGSIGSFLAITAASDATHVTVHVSSTGQVLASSPDAGATIPAVAANGVLTLTLDQGDVAEVLGAPTDTADLSGSLVQADHPVQIIAGTPCINVPLTAPACDHLEQTVAPAETLGAHYVVTVPTAPRGNVVGHVVRFYGNADGTTLTYDPQVPAGCPTALAAGQVVDCGEVTTDFVVTGNHEFAVGTFMLGGSLLDPTMQAPNQEGDPSQSLSVPVEQHRTSYLFAAPEDYDISFVDVAGPTGVSVSLDGVPLTQTFVAIGSSGYGVARVALGKTTAGRHTLTATLPVTIQVIGYGDYTSYQYPGGMNLGLIAPAPTH
ncbi:MAG TPA: IgGFc-binding protein, partial [Solirubrobacteraceae bacterium]